MASPKSIGQPIIEPLMAHIPGGWFLMGSDVGADNERPVHHVWVDAFELGIYQVTNREYQCFVQATGYMPPPFWRDAAFSHPQQPVVGISWFDAVAYCQWLSQQTGRPFRLPTEAEWERAARGGQEGLLYPWGDDPPQSLPDYYRRWRNGPEIVGLSAPNGYGLFNMGENVHEWCSDWYDPTYYARSPEKNPIGPPSGTRRASRGGSWRHHIKVSRSAARSSIPPHFRYNDYGFRIACSKTQNLRA
ncbi:MAG: formylglycine-generating enzyme family protein [Acidobacteriota bacterium]|nr:formylglycine-generating enzyme family protein [Blastocatellia bacterium]MDW8238487.1 formylglycine-generating enzyme family protein [Acidobacteriota bacterium]